MVNLKLQYLKDNLISRFRPMYLLMCFYIQPRFSRYNILCQGISLYLTVNGDTVDNLGSPSNKHPLLRFKSPFETQKMPPILTKYTSWLNTFPESSGWRSSSSLTQVEKTVASDFITNPHFSIDYDGYNFYNRRKPQFKPC